MRSLLQELFYNDREIFKKNRKYIDDEKSSRKLPVSCFYLEEKNVKIIQLN